MKSFIEPQFNYCPLVWMFHDRNLNNKINKLHERALRLLYKDDFSTFNQLLTKEVSVSVHHRNIQSVAIEMYKAKHGLSPVLMKYIFEDRHYEGPTLRLQLYSVTIFYYHKLTQFDMGMIHYAIFAQ